MVSYHYVNNNYDKIGYIDSSLDRLVVYYFCKTINDNQNCVIDIAFLVYKKW